MFIIPKNRHAVPRVFCVIMMKMELPLSFSCGHENMVDLENLEKRPFSRLYTVEGTTCQQCGKWEACWFSTLQLSESMRKLGTMRPDHGSFRFRFIKTLKRAQEIQLRGLAEYGAFRIQNLVAA